MFRIKIEESRFRATNAISIERDNGPTFEFMASRIGGTIRTCKREYVNMKSCAENMHVCSSNEAAEINGGARGRARAFRFPEDLPFVLRPGLDVNFATSTIFTANVCPVWRWMHFLTTLNGPLEQR